MDVDFKGFLVDGAFGSVPASAVKRDIENLLGAPDNFSADAKTYSGARIWKYGDIEFHFPDRTRLTLIHCDSVDSPPSGGTALDIRGLSWFGSTTREEIEGFLAREHIAHTVVGTPVERIETSGKVLILLDADELGPETHLRFRGFSASVAGSVCRR